MKKTSGYRTKFALRCEFGFLIAFDTKSGAWDTRLLTYSYQVRMMGENEAER
jgi:hypothetical protein